MGNCESAFFQYTECWPRIREKQASQLSYHKGKQSQPVSQRGSAGVNWPRAAGTIIAGTGPGSRVRSTRGSIRSCDRAWAPGPGQNDHKNGGP